MTSPISSPRGGGRSKAAIRTTLRPASAVLMGSTAGSTRTASPDGRIVLWYLLQTDVDDRKRSEALLAGEKQLLEMVAGGHSMSEILEAICRLVESTAGGGYCSVLL